MFPGDDASKESFGIVKTRKRGVVRARSAAQDHYLASLRKHELVFAEGPAGTGKTWLAVGHAVSLLEQGLVERLVLSRPAVEAGERLGFLPGDMRDKVDPYLRPIYDALYDFMDGRMVERGLQTGMIEIAPLAFMRGRTLSKAAILLDEAQNATAMQMKMFLTRLGEGSRMMINGDPTQTDLAPGQKSGLGDAIGLLKSIPRVGHVRFTHVDVVRHDLVRQIVEAYERRGPGRTLGRAKMKVALAISVPSGLWRGLPRARALARETIAAAVAESGLAGEGEAEVSLCLADDARLQALNLRWRGVDKPTNVLSFPTAAPGQRRWGIRRARRYRSGLRDAGARGERTRRAARRPLSPSRRPRISPPPRLRSRGGRRGGAHGGARDQDHGPARGGRPLCARSPQGMKNGRGRTERRSGAANGSREQPSGLFERVRALFGLAPPSARDDIEDVIEESASEEFTPQERAILKNVLALHDVRVEDVMVPRADIIALALDTPLSAVLDCFRTAGHSRLPVYDETLDDPRGMIHIRDFVVFLASHPRFGLDDRACAGWRGR